ncbi:DinI family protein [Pasteurellaceae bacterium 15-036681]|nr:DinI family protein [Pasteurellaceae bacterium 15-036681]
MSATIDIRLAKPQGFDQHKFERMLEIVEERTSKAFPTAIVRARKSPSNSDLTVFGLGKEGKKDVGEFLENLFDEGSAFEELQEQYY